MNIQADHCSAEQLHALIDRYLDPAEVRRVTDHLRTCAACTREHQSLLRFDAIVKSVPLESPHKGFTDAVLGRLHIAPRDPVSFRILVGLSYAFGMLIVLAALVTVFILTGVITIGGGNPAADPLTRVVGQFSSMLTWGVEWLAGRMPIVHEKASLVVAFFTAVALGIVLVFDHTAGRWFAHRKG